jgi:hypothetical protein
MSNSSEKLKYVLGRTKMKTRTLITLTIIMTAVIAGGCGPKQRAHSGFLSDYTKLEKGSGSVLRYIDTAVLDRYSGFIVNPVKAHISTSDSKLTPEQVTDLANYMHTKIVEAVQGAGKKVVHQPGQGVARVRIALTNIDKSHAVSILPQASLLGAGIGGASMEAEAVDSVTGKQIAAVIQSGQGSRIPFASLGDWTAAKQAIDGWAKEFQKRLSQ